MSKAVDDTICPRYHSAVEIIGARWSGAIVQSLLNGATRFGEMQSAIPGLSSRMLSARLKELEAEGIVERVSADARASYRLTAKGRALAPVVRTLAAWAEKWVRPPPRRP